jgi:hypothetical protein
MKKASYWAVVARFWTGGFGRRPYESGWKYGGFAGALLCP